MKVESLKVLQKIQVKNFAWDSKYFAIDFTYVSTYAISLQKPFVR